MSENILEAANRLTSKDRREQYGPVSREAEQVAALWSIYLEYRPKPVDKVDPQDYAPLMMLMKLARFCYRQDREDLIDTSGYARCAELLKDADADKPIWEKMLELSNKAVQSERINSLEQEVRDLAAKEIVPPAKSLKETDWTEWAIAQGLTRRKIDAAETASEKMHQEFAEGYEKLASATSDLVEKSRAKKLEADPCSVRSLDAAKDINGSQSFFDQPNADNPGMTNEEVYQKAIRGIGRGRFMGFGKLLKQAADGQEIKPRVYGRSIEKPKETIWVDPTFDLKSVVLPENIEAMENSNFYVPSRYISDQMVPNTAHKDLNQGYIGKSKALEEPHLGLAGVVVKMPVKYDAELPPTVINIGGKRILLPWEVKRFACELDQNQYKLTIAMLFPIRKRLHAALLKANMSQTPALWLNQAIYVESQLGLNKDPGYAIPELIPVEACHSFLAGCFDECTLNEVERFGDPYSVLKVFIEQALDRAESNFKPPSLCGHPDPGPLDPQASFADVVENPVPHQTIVGEGVKEMLKYNTTADAGVWKAATLGEPKPASLVLEGICVATGRVEAAKTQCDKCKRCLCEKCADWHRQTFCSLLTWYNRDAIKAEFEYYASKAVKTVAKEEGFDKESLVPVEPSELNAPIITRVHSRHGGDNENTCS